jgi:hypothetical protein
MIALAIIFLFNTALITHWWLVILGGIAGALFAVSLGLLLGSVIEIRQQLLHRAWPILILLIGPLFLSLLIDILPSALLTAFRFIPTVALANVIRVSFTKDALLSDFGPELALVLAATFLILTGVVIKLRRSQH